jgi:hypothetical protein
MRLSLGADATVTNLVTSGLKLRFDIVNPRAVAWAETRSAQLIAQGSDQTKDMIPA